MAQCDILRDDGRYLVGPSATGTSEKPGDPFAGIGAAMAAINRYRLALAVFAPDSPNKNAGFTIIDRSR